MRKALLGELTAHITGGTDGSGGGTGPVVVLLHGFGAPGTDLVPLAGELEVGPEFRFVFPMAPHALENGPADSVGRAWWMIDMAALQVAVMTRNYAGLVSNEPDGLASARAALESLLSAVDNDLSRGAPVYLGGFSQGAMLATDVVLRSERPFAGLVVLSGMLLARNTWTALAPRHAGLRVFQSHGTSDPVLPFPVAEELHQELARAGLPVDWHAFSGGHGIPRSVLTALSRFLIQKE